MIESGHWYVTPDVAVPQWCLLILETDPVNGISETTGWHVGQANRRQLLQSESAHIDSYDTEAELLYGLIQELEPLRRDNLTLITRKESTLSILRTRFLACGIEEATFRGFDHFSIEEILSRYFTTLGELSFDDSANQGRETSVTCTWETISNLCGEEYHTPLQELWLVLLRIGPLVPQECLGGRPL